MLQRDEIGQSICVLGMHRSGTSCLTGIIQRFGVELGEVFESNPFNKKGNRENARIMVLNDSVLAFNGGAWNKPVDVVAWSDDQVIERDSILADIGTRGSAFWGFKDPRFLLTYPFWLEAISPRYIATFRHPYRVASSLNQRSGMPIEEGLSLWYAYNDRLLKIISESQSPLLNFDLEAEKYLKDAIKKMVLLGLPASYAGQAAEFFDADLRNQQDTIIAVEGLPRATMKLYDTLKDYCATYSDTEGLLG